MPADLNSVRDFWNSESCGERYAIGTTQQDEFAAETFARYKLEPYILDFANFEGFRGLDVLEIGVGFGSDHSKIASSGPNSLTGIDLTDRAIKNTQNRFEKMKLESDLCVGNAEKLPFDSESFDAVYSWGVLHHSPDTPKCFEEVYRVLRQGGFAKIMIYHTHAPTGWMLWVKYALFSGRPFMSLEEIYSKFLESPGTKAYSVAEARELVHRFTEVDIKVQLGFGDLLQGDVGSRHRGAMLTIAKALYPRWLIKGLAKLLPIGLCLLISVKK